MHMIKDTKVANGAPNPTSKRVIPFILLRAKETGILIKNVAIRLCTIGKTGCPHPLKKEFIQKIKQTRIQSILYDLKYIAAVYITSLSLENRDVILSGEICEYIQKAIPITKEQAIPP